MVKYLGSKRLLVPVIEALVRRLPIATACDVFAGTTRVGQALRRTGVRVHSNDLATYSEALGQAYIAADAADRTRLGELLAHLRALPGRHGYFTETFCVRSRFFQPHNGMRVDAIRDEIDRLRLTAVERGLALTSLIEAADRVDSTCGLQMAYVKSWAPRSFNALDLREPEVVDGPAGTVSRLDAAELAGALRGVDCAYLDPPYNQHSYFSNYHVWETLMRWDAPEHYGVACKRVDCKTTKSPYNRRNDAWPAFCDLVARLPTPWIVASCSDEGFHDPADVAALLARERHVAAIAIDAPRYIGARIGIFDPRGRRVGAVSHVRNKELLFVAGPDAGAVRDAMGSLRSAALSGARTAAGPCGPPDAAH